MSEMSHDTAGPSCDIAGQLSTVWRLFASQNLLVGCGGSTTSEKPASCDRRAQVSATGRRSGLGRSIWAWAVLVAFFSHPSRASPGATHPNVVAEAGPDRPDGNADVEQRGAAGKKNTPTEGKGERATGSSEQVSSDLESVDAGNYWADQNARPFAFTRIDAGAVNQIEVGAGYGIPRWMWTGISADAFVAPGFSAFQVALRAEIQLVNLQLSFRRVVTFSRHFAEPQPVYRASDFQAETQPRSFYSSLAGHLWGFVPAGPTLGMWDLRGELLPNAPASVTVFSEHARMPLQVHRLLMPSLTWWWMFEGGKYLVGPSMDWTLTPGRNAMYRLGPSICVQLGPHFSLQMLLTLPVVRPDRMNYWSQIWGTVGVEWYLASGEPRPGIF